MKIKKLLIKNYKIFRNRYIQLNDNVNIFVGDNDSGKSTILEALSIVTCCRLNGVGLDRQLTVNLFNIAVRLEYIESIINGSPVAPPSIEIEAYCEKSDEYASLQGTNNSCTEDCPGVKMMIEFDSEYSAAYKTLLTQKNVFDIPLEFYKIRYLSFKGEPINWRSTPFRVAHIDTSKKDYGNVINRFVSENVSSYLSESEQIDLRVAYRKNHSSFKSNEIVARLNKTIEESIKLADKKVSIGIREEGLDEWKNQLSIAVDDIPFEYIGVGSQNVVKVELVLKNEDADTNILLIEEPENNLSYSNMSKLISKIQRNSDKQVFISTHSSFVANKLGLSNLFIIAAGNVSPLTALNIEAMNYFKKLPGYDTLRLVIATRVILVEGPTEELLVQRAYFDLNGKLPIEDGVDVIVVDSLAFKRYCDLAILINKDVAVITDNDGDIQKNINEKYSDYARNANIRIFYEADIHLRTVEPCVLDVNSQTTDDFTNFRKAISKKNSHMNDSKDDILSFMQKNKTEWSMRVFDFPDKIKYPLYILDAIK